MAKKKKNNKLIIGIGILAILLIVGIIWFLPKDTTNGMVGFVTCGYEEYSDFPVNPNTCDIQTVKIAEKEGGTVVELDCLCKEGFHYTSFIKGGKIFDEFANPASELCSGC